MTSSRPSRRFRNVWSWIGWFLLWMGIMVIAENGTVLPWYGGGGGGVVVVPRPVMDYSSRLQSPLEQMKSKQSCHYEEGIGSFLSLSSSSSSPGIKDADGDGRGQGNMTWNWTSTVPNCPIVDYISPLLRSKSKQTLEGEWSFQIREPLTLLFIGDSLDRNMIAYACTEGLAKGFHVLPTYKQLLQNGSLNVVDPTSPPQSSSSSSSSSSSLSSKHDTRRRQPPHPHRGGIPINMGKSEASSVRICTTGNISLAYFRIFGMTHSCSCGPWKRKEESRDSLFPTTEDRIRTLLPFEVLSRIPTMSKIVVNAGSCLWDLCQGCVEKGAVNESYAQNYKEGIQRLHRVIHEVIPNITMIYWRTSPPISQPYDTDRETSGWARTRRNQDFLNQILKKTVTEHNLGKVADWWAQVSGVPEETITESMEDRSVHYKKEPSLAFFNMWLNAVFDEDPRLLVVHHARDK